MSLQKEPLVSIILPSYKMGSYVSRALESIGKQTYTNWEVLLVDDCGPEDGTHNAVLEFQSNYPANRVQYIRNSENFGIGNSRNIAIAESRVNFWPFSTLMTSGVITISGRR